MFRHAAAPSAHTKEPITVAAVDEAPLAGPAVSVPDGWLDANLVALLDVCNALADFLDDARELVTDGQGKSLPGKGVWMSRGGDEVGTTKEFVEVSAADATILWGNPHPAGLDWVGERHLLETDIPLAVELHRVHCCNRTHGLGGGGGDGDVGGDVVGDGGDKSDMQDRSINQLWLRKLGECGICLELCLLFIW